MIHSLAMILASHCVENPILCEPEKIPWWAPALDTAGGVMTAIAALIGLLVALGVGWGKDAAGLKKTLLIGAGFVAGAMVMFAIASRLPLFTPLLASPFLAAGVVRYIKETGNTKLARQLGVGLAVVMGLSGLIVVGGFILFMLAMNSWANSK